MDRSTAPHFYRAHGLVVRADFALAELPLAAAMDRVDLVVRLDPSAADAYSSGAGEDGAFRLVEGRGAAFRIEDVGAFWVPDGGEIRVAPADGADPKAVVLYTLGSAMGLALMLRGALVLHAAAVLVEGKAVLFLGPSGAGKSTLAAAFARAGTPTLGDDTVALWPGTGGAGFTVRPAAASFKMWHDALSAANVAPDGLASVAERADKYYLPNERPAEDRPHPVGDVLVLGGAGETAPARVRPLGLLEAVQAVSQNLYRPFLVARLGLREARFRDICTLAEAVPVGRLERPWGHASVDGLVGMLRGRGAGGV